MMMCTTTISCTPKQVERASSRLPSSCFVFFFSFSFVRVYISETECACHKPNISFVMTCVVRCVSGGNEMLLLPLLMMMMIMCNVMMMLWRGGEGGDHCAACATNSPTTMRCLWCRKGVCCLCLAVRRSMIMLAENHTEIYSNRGNVFQRRDDLSN